MTMSHHEDPIVIVGAKRTAIGRFGGQYKQTSAPVLAASCIKAAYMQAHINKNNIQKVFVGCVLTAGMGQAPARQAAYLAGCSMQTSAVTINKMCGSSLEALLLACQTLQAQRADVVVAAGMENMSLAPYLLTHMRFGKRLGHDKTIDHLYKDGLEDAYEVGALMGVFADRCADALSISRQQQDDWARQSMQRALEAQQQDFFVDEISAIEIKQRGKAISIATDEIPSDRYLTKLAELKPVFNPDGTVTAANASAIGDGAAALLLTRRSYADENELVPLATIIDYVEYAGPSDDFCMAPMEAIAQLCERNHWSIEDVDLFEINEAFAVVNLAAAQRLNIPAEKINVHGGACALGHPLGATGARIMTTLIYALKRAHKKRGIAALCIGGGEAIAVAIEIV